MNWTETKTEGRQIAKSGLINAALRLAQAKAKLVGVDVTGRAQREAALAEERQRREAVREQETGVKDQEAEAEARRDEEPKVKKPLIKKHEKNAVAAEIVQPQVIAGQEDRSHFGTEEYIKNEVCKQLINDLRSDPGCAGWTDEQFRDYAQRVWDARPQEGGTAEAAELASSRGADPQPGDLLRGDILSVPRGRTNRPPEMRHRREIRHSNQERRRDFLAPLAVD